MNFEALPLLLFIGLVLSVSYVILTDLQEREDEIQSYEDEDMR